MMKTIAIALALSVAAITTAAAGDNSCAGLIIVGKEWTTIIDKELPDNTCRFKTDSDMGRTILSACPDGSFCFVEMPLPERDRNTKRTPVPGASPRIDIISAPAAKTKAYQQP